MARAEPEIARPLNFMDLTESVTLVLAGIPMSIHADAPCRPGLWRLAQAWSSCKTESDAAASPAAIPRSEIFVSQEPHSGHVLVRAGLLVEEGEFDLAECHLAIERALYSELARLLAVGDQMLHAGAVATDTSAILFVGPSGAGKSSLCLAATLGGANYLSDDIVVTDGVAVRGVARAIQFDPPNLAVPFPEWLKSAPLDFETYGRLSEGEDNSAPLFIPGPGLTLAQAPASDFMTVIVERGTETKLWPVSRSEALGELVGASFRRDKPVDLGGLLARRAYRLIWREPTEAWRELESLGL